MGGKSRRKGPRKRKRRTSNPKPQKDDTGRKAGWLWTAAIAVGLAIFGYQPLFGDRETSSYTKPEPDKPTVAVVEQESELETAASEPGPWDFLENGYNVQGEWQHIKDNGVQLGKKMYHRHPGAISEAVEYHKSQIVLTSLRNQWNTEDLSYLLSYHVHALPASQEHRSSIAEYCQKAEAHMHESIDGLECDRVEWIPIKPGDDYSEDYDGKAFVGETSFLSYALHVTNEKTGEKIELDYKLTRTDGNQVRSFFDTNEDGSVSNEKTFIFIGRGFGTLSGPVSELIPYCTSDVENEYLAEVGSLQSAQVAEAFSEGVSYVLTNELVDELEIPDGHEHVDKLTGNMNADFDGIQGKVYDLVPRGIEWVQEHGVQAAHDLYTQEGPAAFLEAIQGPVE